MTIRSCQVTDINIVNKMFGIFWQ